MKTLHLIIAILGILTVFTGCETLKVNGGLSFTNGTESVAVTSNGKSIRVHGGVNLNGSEVGADVNLPLPRRNVNGLAK